MPLFSKLGKYTSVGLLIIRLGIGAMMIVHGYPKLIGGPEKWSAIGGTMSNIGITQFPVFWGFMAAVTEAFGGLLLILGLAFRPACLFLLFTMIMAAVTHIVGGDGIAGASHPIELASLFLGLFIIGPGKYSVDKK